ncbi:MAG: hypothetical protein EP335_00420 [Alphaproteobacteria bacterium]|nr:MAG: hypothetical protein EP335_00420 [Alphaproteobacteria bacterium]
MIAIMQPYFVPFIGYFQLVSAVDTFVLYDDVQFTKKGYMTANAINLEGVAETVSLNVRDKSRIDIVRNKTLAADEFAKSLRKLKAKLARRPHFDADLFDRIMTPGSDNLYDYLAGQIATVADHLGIRTRIVRSSDIADTAALKGEDKIVALCQALGDSDYLNSSGGQALYTKEGMAGHGIRLHWLHYRAEADGIMAPNAIIQSLMDHDRAALSALARVHVIS